MTFPSLHMAGLEGQERTLAPGERGTLDLVFDQPGIYRGARVGFDRSSTRSCAY